MNDHEPTPRSHEQIDLERLRRAANRFENAITLGIGAARSAGREIDDGTAQLIAHVLGRGLGRDSQLAEHGRTRQGDPEAMRAEFTTLWEHPRTGGLAREWINWLSTYLLHSEPGPEVPDGDQVEAARALLRSTLVTDQLNVGGVTLTVNIPASLTGPELREVVARLEQLPEIFEQSFHAFLTLPDVDASAENVADLFEQYFVGRFESEDDAIDGLTPIDEWETRLGEWTAELGLPADAVTLDRSVISAQLREVYDVVEMEGRIYAFIR